MKKSKEVSLILITAALASCNRPNKEWSSGEKHVYMRSDTTTEYSPAHTYSGHHLWYYAFRPYGNYTNNYSGGGYYSRYGYYNDAISEHSNYSSGSAKSTVSRGGFGEGSFSVSS